MTKSHGSRCHVLLIHGILANKGNLRTLAKRLGEKFPHWHIETVDLRYHGQAQGVFSSPNNLESCAKDLLGRFQPDIVIGHSFGGKVALALSELISIKEVWILDASPGPVQVDYSVIDVLEKCQKSLSSRREWVEQFQEKGLSREVALWMTTNLRETDQGLELIFNLTMIRQLLQSYSQMSFGCTRSNTEYHFVHAEFSRAFVVPSLPNVHLHELEKSGHWVHVDNLEGLLGIIFEYSLLSKGFSC